MERVYRVQLKIRLHFRMPINVGKILVQLGRYLGYLKNNISDIFKLGIISVKFITN